MKVLLYLFIFSFSSFYFAQSGSVDLTFNTNDIGFGYGDGLNGGIVNTVTCRSTQNDGKILLGGDFLFIDSTSSRGLARIDSLGNIDTTFNIGLGFNYGLTYPNVYALGIQNNGKIWVGGNFWNFNSMPYTGLVRLNQNGSIDNSFNPQFTIYNVDQIEFLQNGKVLMNGSFLTNLGQSLDMIVVDTNGVIDNSIDTNLDNNNSIVGFKVQHDQKIIVYGWFTTINGLPNKRIVRLLPNFETDTTFNVGEGPQGINPYISSISISNDSSYFVCGHITTFNNYNLQNVVKLNNDGTINFSFNIPDVTINSVGQVIPLHNSNSHIIIGNFTYQSEKRNIIKVDSNNIIDPNYNNLFMHISQYSYFDIDSNDRLLCFGQSSDRNAPLLRFNLDGTIDSSFFRYSGSNDLIKGSIVQNDNKILLFGNNLVYNGTCINRIFRIHHNGDLDTTFNYINYNTYSINNVRLLSNGKYLVKGFFTDNLGNSFHLIRINHDGSIDSTFHFPLVLPSASSNNKLLLVQSDNKIIIAEGMTSFDGIAVNNIIRLNEDGTLDNSFVVGNGTTHLPSDAILQDDGKILLTGSNLNYYNGTLYKGAIRLHQDGSIDNTFNLGLGFNNAVYCVKQYGNKLFFGGNFTTVQGVTKNRLVRMNMDGTLDNTFSIGTGFDNLIQNIELQSDGKILLSGGFLNFNGEYKPSIIRLNTNGSIDSSISFDLVTQYQIQSMKIRLDQKILLTGYFTKLGNIGRNRIAVLNNCLVSTNSQTIISCDSYLWPVNGQIYYSSGTYEDTLLNYTGCDSIITLNLTIIPSQPLNVSTFSLPTPIDSCVGYLAVNSSGNSNFIQQVDTLLPQTSNGYILFDSLCSGVHTLKTIDACGDTLTTPFVIPIDSNYVFNNPFIDSLAMDSLGITLTNCTIYYNSIDTAYIDSIFTTGNLATVIWNIVDSNGSNYDTTTYLLNNGPGVYNLQLNVFCPTKVTGDYFTVTEAVYFNNGSTYYFNEIENFKQDVFELFPNPTSDIVNICLVDEKANLNIYDSNGRLLMNKTINQKEVLSMSNFENGIYLFEIITNSNIAVKKVIKK